MSSVSGRAAVPIQVPAFSDFLIGRLPAAAGRKMHFTGTTVLKVIDGKIVEEIGLDDGVTALTPARPSQGGVIEKAAGLFAKGNAARCRPFIE